MSTSKVVYTGQLRTENTHLKSGNSYITDAPTDNNGKGEAFSPTDTVATGLANCMLTMMGIKARDLAGSLDGSYAEVTKTMASNPRRITGIMVLLYLPAHYSKKERAILTNTANTCPVHHSLHPDIQKDIQYHWEL
ncbi:MAG: OsmC family protein [Gilvibacter sp.]